MSVKTFSISVGTSNIGQVLKARLVDIAGAAQGSDITTGFAMPTSGTWTSSIGTWTGTIPVGFDGAVQIIRNSDDKIIYTEAINPDTSSPSIVGPVTQQILVKDGSNVAVPNASVSLSNEDHTAVGTTNGAGAVTLGVYADDWVLAIIKDGKDYTPTTHTITDGLTPIVATVVDESTIYDWEYANQQDVVDAISANNLVVMSQQDGTDTSIDSNRVLRAGLWSDAYINTALKKMFITPLQNMSADDIEIINTISVNLTLWMLAGYRIVQFADQRVSAQRMYASFKKDADDMLDNIMWGVLPLGATRVDAVTAPSGNTDAVDINNQRMYPKSNLYLSPRADIFSL